MTAIKWADITTKVVFFLLTLFVGIVAWHGQQFVEEQNELRRDLLLLQTRIVAIEANRYTSGDALKDARAQRQGIDDLRSWIEREYPPQYLLEDVRDLRQRIVALERGN